MAMLLLAAACTAPVGELQRKELAAGWGENQVRHATGFTLQRKDGVTRIAVCGHWDTLKSEPLAIYYFVKDTATRVPADGEKITVPAGRIVTTSTTQYEPLMLLGCIDSIVGVCSAERTFNPHLRFKIAKQEVASLGESYNINRERLLMCKPKAIVACQYMAIDKTLSTLRKTGADVLLDQEWQESTMLGRAEWIKLFGAMLGKEKEAEEIFNATCAAYDSLKETARKAEEHPRIIHGGSFQGTWYVPGGGSYMANLYRDAGAQYYYSADTHTGSLPLQLETVMSNFGDATFWLGAQGNTLAEVGNAEPRAQRLPAFRQGNVFSYNRRRSPGTGSDFWEGAVYHPDWLLADVMKALHPQLMENHEWVYVEHLK